MNCLEIWRRRLSSAWESGVDGTFGFQFHIFFLFVFPRISLGYFISAFRLIDKLGNSTKSSETKMCA